MFFNNCSHSQHKQLRSQQFDIAKVLSSQYLTKFANKKFFLQQSHKENLLRQQIFAKIP